MSVKSVLKSGQEKSSYQAITAAMNSDIGAAMLEDKNSGLRKIRVLVEEVDELSDFSVKFSEDRVTFSVVMSLAMTGTDQRIKAAE